MHIPPPRPTGRRALWRPVGALMAAAVLMTGCLGGDNEPRSADGKPSGQVSFAFWGVPEEKKVQEELKKAFEAKNSGITVQLNHVSSFGDFYPQMLSRVAGGNPPDVMYLGEGAVQSFAARNALTDLAPFIERDGFNMDVFFDQAVQPLKDDQGRVWALAKDTTPIMLYYNEKLFEDAGVPLPTGDWKWDDMVSAARKLTVDKDNDGRVDQWGVGIDTYWTQWMAAVYSNGGDVLNEERNQCLLDQPAASDALQREADLMNKDPIVSPSPEVLTGMGVGIQELFNSGKLGMFFSGRWGAFFIGDVGFPWGVAPYPYMSERKTIATFVTLAIPRAAKNPAAAWEFIKFVLSDEGQKINASTGLGLPVVESVANEGSSWLLPDEPREHVERYTKSYTERTKPLPLHPQWQETIDEITIRELDGMWLGKKSAKDAAAAACAAIKPLIANN